LSYIKNGKRRIKRTKPSSSLSSSDPEDKDEYLAEHVFYMPPSARWNYLQHQRAKLPSIGKDIDDAILYEEKVAAI
jgi:type I restriction enzyme M protein